MSISGFGHASAKRNDFERLSRCQRAASLGVGSSHNDLWTGTLGSASRDSLQRRRLVRAELCRDRAGSGCCVEDDTFAQQPGLQPFGLSHAVDATMSYGIAQGLAVRRSGLQAGQLALLSRGPFIKRLIHHAAHSSSGSAIERPVL